MVHWQNERSEEPNHLATDLDLHGRVASGAQPFRVSEDANRVGRYELMQKLSESDTNTVFLARDNRLGRMTAIKFLLQRDRQAIDRFVAGARTMARLSHENIATIHEVNEHRGMPYVALEYFEGRSLRQWLLESEAHANGSVARVDGQLAVELILPVVRALAHAHSQGVVHGDIRPENVVMTDSGTIKVLGFANAIVRHNRGPDGAPARQLGTPIDSGRDPSCHEETGARKTRYMAPEQWIRNTTLAIRPGLQGGVEQGQRSAPPIDHRADIWAIGVMLYEMVVGRHPLSAARQAEVKDLSVPMPSAHRARPNLGKLGRVIDLCLAKLPDRRPANAGRLLDYLIGVLPKDHAERADGGVQSLVQAVGTAAKIARAAMRIAPWAILMALFMVLGMCALSPELEEITEPASTQHEPVELELIDAFNTAAQQLPTLRAERLDRSALPSLQAPSGTDMSGGVPPWASVPEVQSQALEQVVTEVLDQMRAARRARHRGSDRRDEKVPPTPGRAKAHLD